jgi:CRISPR/Cas system-associated protein endoribonuclease Cas2
MIEPRTERNATHRSLSLRMPDDGSLRSHSLTEKRNVRVLCGLKVATKKKECIGRTDGGRLAVVGDERSL